jgi:hypothetical protein
MSHYLAPDYVFERNVIIGAPAAMYPTGNSYPPTPFGVGFVDFTAGNYRLSARSALKGRATDGTDPGADIDAVEAHTRGVR